MNRDYDSTVARMDPRTWREVWRDGDNPQDFYADSICVEPISGAIKLSAGGFVSVFPSIRAILEESHIMTSRTEPKEED